MTRESLFYKILSGIHIVLFTSILCFGMILLSGTLLMIPVLGATFQIGKDAIYKKLDITDSIIKTFFLYFKDSFTLAKFIPVSMILLLNVAGMIQAARAGIMLYSVACLAIIAMLIVFMLYVAGYYTFVDKKVKCMNVIICMLLKPQFLISIFIVMVLCAFFFSGTMIRILIFSGSFFLFVLEVMIFIQTLTYKKVLGTLTEDEEYAYLVDRQIKSQ